MENLSNNSFSFVYTCCNFFSGPVWIIIISWFLLSSYLSNLILVWLVILGLRRVHVACLRFLGLVTDYMLRVNLSLIIGNMRIQENNNTLLHDPINKRILRGPSSSATSSFKYLGKDLIDTFGFVVVSFFWFGR